MISRACGLPPPQPRDMPTSTLQTNTRLHWGATGTLQQDSRCDYQAHTLLAHAAHSQRVLLKSVVEQAGCCAGLYRICPREGHLQRHLRHPTQFTAKYLPRMASMPRV